MNAFITTKNRMNESCVCAQFLMKNNVNLWAFYVYKYFLAGLVVMILTCKDNLEWHLWPRKNEKNERFFLFCRASLGSVMCAKNSSSPHHHTIIYIFYVHKKAFLFEERTNFEETNDNALVSIWLFQTSRASH